MGDQNIKYFHTVTIKRRARNKIARIKLEDGSFATERQLIGKHLVHYVENLFTSSVDTGD